jgi:hypothetical protein
MIAFGQYIAFDQYIVSKIPIPTLIKELPEEEKEAVSVMGFYSLVLILITELFYFNSANMDDDMQKGIKIMVLIAVTSTLLFGCIYVGHFLL